MKKIIFSLSIISLFITGCFKDDEEIRQAYKEAVMPVISGLNPSFFNLDDLQHAYIEFVVDFETPARSVTIEETFLGHKKVLGTYTSFPATVRITASEALEGLPGLTIDSLDLGDNFLFEIVAESNAGVKSRSNILVNASVACESDLTGIYSVLANGSSTDPTVSADVNPAVDYVSEVSLTETDVNGIYVISDFSGGLYPLWYGDPYGMTADDCSGTIRDVCGSLSYYNCYEPFGSPVEGDGTIDQGTGIITLEGTATAWGDAWTIVLTPKK